ncbi:MAG: SdiA-regulated domain-containing protein [Chitinophagales bacterium]|nr:SdiA-regulated domain-containing protein [Chitinophagales bacterium]
MGKVFFVSIFCLFVSATCAQSKFNYSLNEPTIRQQLPEILNEVSGLTDVDLSKVACVQDELGIVFIYDFRSGEIVSQHRFDSIGDFEGLTYAKNSLYILRSDGRLTEWRNFPSSNDSLSHHSLTLATANNEGLCFDPQNNRILIAAKSKPLNPDQKTERFIYAYDLTTNKLEEEPIYSLDVKYLEEKARSFNIVPTDTNAKGKIKPFNFRPASLSVHPITNDIYIISAADRILLAMNRKGEVIYMESLDREMYAKAEGITFLKDGTMIITNEAGGKAPTLLVFEMKR